MKKQVLFVIESLHCGGAEKSIITLLNNLNYSSLDVSLLLFREGGSFEKFIAPEVKVFYHKSLITSSKCSYILRRVKFWLLKKMNFGKKNHTAQLFWKSFGKCVPSLSNNYHIAIAYNQGFSTYFVSQRVRAGKKFAWINVDYVKAGYNPSFDYELYKPFDKIVTVSPACKDSFVGAMKDTYIENKVIVIKDIVDKDTVLAMSKEPLIHSFDNTCVNLVTVARLTSCKGHQLIPPCCRALIDKGYKVHWYIVGEGAERKNIEQQIRELNLCDNITLTGFTDNPYPYMMACDIYVQPSFFEGLGLTVIEASLLGKSIVTTNFPTSIIEHGKTGLVCEMNSDDIARHIEFFIEDIALREKVSANLKKKKVKDKETSLETFYSLIEL